MCDNLYFARNTPSGRRDSDLDSSSSATYSYCYCMVNTSWRPAAVASFGCEDSSSLCGACWWVSAVVYGFRRLSHALSSLSHMIPQWSESGSSMLQCQSLCSLTWVVLDSWRRASVCTSYHCLLGVHSLAMVASHTPVDPSMNVCCHLWGASRRNKCWSSCCIFWRIDCRRKVMATCLQGTIGNHSQSGRWKPPKSHPCSWSSYSS